MIHTFMYMNVHQCL